MKTMERGRLRRLCVALALAGSPTLHAAEGLVERFDTAVTGGFPVTLPAARGPGASLTMHGRDAGTEELVVLGRLSSESTFSDGQAVALYDVRFRGRDALAIRHGDSLYVASLDERQLHSTRYTLGSECPEESDTAIDGPHGSGPIDDEPAPHTPELGADNDEPSRDLNLFAFVHDDVPVNDDELFSRYFAWWIKRMEFDVLEDRRIHVHLRRAIPGVTDAFYGYSGAIGHWIRAARQYADPHVPVAAGTYRHRRSVLLVDGAEVEPGLAGIAEGHGRSFAMASTRGSIVVPAHEIGHLMGATHEHAERRYTGPFSTCDTIMYPVDPTVACKAYSLSNVRLIRETMDYRGRR